ncbi:MAG TPA: PLD nuclease N-terminal domain-containing protein [Pseudogracilibacillus sp.]|nr:PLD nuclease N-terminal domain-containing protein [Pseudogracilibacillus sp.]
MELINDNLLLILPLVLIQLILMIVALVDLVKSSEVNGPKGLWVIVIIFINVFGPIIYFIFGRKQS